MKHLRTIVWLTGCLAVTGCGGGSGGTGQVGRVLPTPAPPPPPPSDVGTFADVFSLDKSTDLAAFGYDIRWKTGGADVSDDVSVHYDAAQGAYIVELPYHGSGGFYVDEDYDTSWYGTLANPAAPTERQNVELYVEKPLLTYQNLEYSTIAYLSANDQSAGYLVFGVPTLASDMPVTGSATYAANVTGLAVGGGYIGGTADFLFNFGAGSLSGAMEVSAYDAWDGYFIGTYDFVNTVYSTGSTTFSGGLKDKSTNLAGTFNGAFTGTGAAELIGQFEFQFRDTYTSDLLTAYGVFNGKKQ
ncbi:hypothetical protein [Sphingomicrobium nitratireducens]|uniref:hypothetical protein n=1 Tax=Sphingomicrobium nitratireducens TaxID=2964666 RepID=UPI00223EE930|nr:hypothetical protein [Sphingomicrobium nitratireducens]